MRKVAIFVEGKTEQELIVKLVKHLVESHLTIEFELSYQFGGSVTLRHTTSNGSFDYYVLVVDCRSDGQVKTQICEKHPSLLAAGYTAVMGLRDVFPINKSDIELLRMGLSKDLPPNTPIYLAVMEVEAWFLAETNHYSIIDSQLTASHIKVNGFGDELQNPENCQHPAKTLDNIYKLVGKRYMKNDGSKTKKSIQRTLSALSHTELKATVRNKCSSLHEFLCGLEKTLM